MNNKKIIFGILLFCAISFLAYTFANPLEKEEEGKLVPGSNTVQNTPKDDDDDDNVIDEPVKVDDLIDDDLSNETLTEPVVVTPVPTRPATSNSATSRPSGTNTNNGGNSGSSSSSGNSGTQVPVVEVTGITITSPSNPTLVPGKTLNLGANVSPSNATNQSITYTSNNTDVVVVDGNGNVTAVGSGTATVTITASNGVSNTVTFKVVDNEISQVTASSSVANTVITGVGQGTTSISISGTVVQGTDHELELRIYVPSSYTADMLQNLKYYLMNVGDYGINPNEHTYTGIGRINDVSKISSGEAYVVLPLEFDDDMVKGEDGPLKISVNWLNSKNPIIYSIDFKTMTIK